MPIVTEEGFFLFVGGKRIARKLTSLEDKFRDHVFTVTRHGAEGDTNASYEVTTAKDKETYAKLKAVMGHTFSQEALEEAITEAGEIANR